MIDLMKLKLKILKHLLVYCRFDEWNDSHRPLTGVTIRTRFIARSGILTNVNIPQACLLNLCENSQGGVVEQKMSKGFEPLVPLGTYPTYFNYKHSKWLSLKCVTSPQFCHWYRLIVIDPGVWNWCFKFKSVSS